MDTTLSASNSSNTNASNCVPGSSTVPLSSSSTSTSSSSSSSSSSTDLSHNNIKSEGMTPMVMTTSVSLSTATSTVASSKMSLPPICHVSTTSVPVPSATTSSSTSSGPTASNATSNSSTSTTGKRREIYKYEAPWTVYSMNWSVRPDKKFRLALGSFIEEYGNQVQVVTLDEETGEFFPHSTFEHPYPTTKMMWMPDGKGIMPDLMATSGDYLRVWRVTDTDTRLEVLLNNNKNSDFCAPLTSFDWNEVDPNLIGSSSIDTTCTIWGIETGQAIGRVGPITGHVKTQLIAHDKEVYDIAFSRAGGGRDMFASVGADGSVRMFDLRHLEHSTIIYEDRAHSPLLRLAWNKQDPNYLGTFAMDSVDVVILDVRMPCTPVARLSNHRSCVNGIAWAPHSSYHICTAADDCQALIWDIQEIPRVIEDPILAYAAAGQINQIQWASTQPDWIAICYHNILEILRV